MEYKDQENGFDPESLDYSTYESAELERLFESAETDSEAYNAIMEELTKRGYDFGVEDPEPIREPITVPLRLRYSIIGTRIWNLAALLVGVLGAAFFLKVQTSFGQVDPSLRIMVYSMVAVLVSLSYLISGIRLLANHKDQENLSRAVPTLEYWFLTFVWFGFSCYQIYTGVKSFMMYFRMQLGYEIALFASLPSVMMVLFSFLLGMSMLYLALELRMPRTQKLTN